MKACHRFYQIILIVIIIFLPMSALQAQTPVKVMPMGNSITWGKLLLESPDVSGTHGYRKTLFDQVKANGINVRFVGPQAGNPKYNATYDNDAPYEGYFRDGRHVGEFLPDSTWDVRAMLNAMPLDSLPEYVILHIGTNDMAKGSEIGDWQTPGTVTYRLYKLVDVLLTYSRSGRTIKKIYLNKIIPKGQDVARGYVYPAINERIETYNARMESFVNAQTQAIKNRLTLIDMHTEFFQNQSAYFTIDIDATHPNATGYAAMANRLFAILYKDWRPGNEDDFDRAAGALNNSNRWRASSGIQLSGLSGAAYDGVIYCNNLGTAWNNLAIWPKSENANTIHMTFHAAATNFNTVAMAIALDDSIPSQADGYMVWISGGLLRVFTIENGVSGNNALSSQTVPVTQYGAGDKFTVNFRKETDRNLFDISINDNQIATVQHSSGTWAKSTPVYSGVLFKGQSGTPPGSAAMVTHYLAQTANPDPVPPGQITYFEAVTAEYNSISLRWDATGDDGQSGTASRYDMRISTKPMQTKADIENADLVTGLTAPFPAGTRETFKVRNLNSGQRYYLAIRAVDEWGNSGTWSQVIDRKTPDRYPVWDQFTDLNEWSYNSTDYGRDTRPGTAGEFTNIRSTGGFPQSVAVFKGAANPSTVNLIWGNEVTYGAPSAVDNGGFAVMLNSDKPNADGYAIFIRTVSRNIFLFTLSNGAADELIGQVPYILKDNLGNPIFPVEDDTLKVVIDSENPAYNRFDVFLNSEAAGEQPLYDVQKRHSGTGTKYAGLYLSGVYGLPGRNNNVYKFGSISEYIYDINVEPQLLGVTEGLVKSTLPQPVKLKITDKNQNPKVGWPVYYWVETEQTGGTISAPPAIKDPIRIEAEWGRVVQNESAIDIPEHHLASRGKYVDFAGGTSQSGYVEWSFYVAEPGDYYFWVRAVARAWNSSILWFQLDGVPEVNDGQYWTLDGNYSADNYDFKWDRVRLNKGLPFHRNLNVGLHTMRFYKGHHGVKLDKVMITRNSTYQPVGVDTVKTLFTDIDGFANTNWTLGEKAGVNRVRARVFSKDDIYEWTAAGLAAAPHHMTPSTSTTPQSGVARATLALPFETTVYDLYNNPAPGVSVIWRVTTGDGVFVQTNADSCITTTNVNGKTSAQFKLGIMDSLNIVTASFTGYTGTTQFLGNVTSGLIRDLQAIQPIKAKHYVGDILPNHVKVKVLDDKGKVVVNVPVQFEITQGNAQPGTRQPKMTGADGIASDTLKYGTSAGVVKVQARASTLTKEIFVDSVYYKANKIRLFAGQNGVAQLGDTLKQRMKVQVLDKYNRGLANHPVWFRTKAPRDHGWKFTGDKDSVMVMTAVNGVATANIRAGLVHGAYENLVEVRTTDGFFALKGEPTYPVKFTLHAQSKASILEKFSVDSTEGIVTERLPDPIVVRMLDSQVPPQPVPYQPVTFHIEAGGGHFEGLPPTDADTTVFTNGEGLASVDLFLGSDAGYFNNIVKATATNGVTSLYPPGGLLFYFSAKSSNADTLIRVGEQIVTGVVGKTMEKSIQVKVEDAAGNGVPGVSVTYSVLSDGGALNYAADTTMVVITQTTEGVASIKWKLGPTAGSQNNVLQATAFNGLIPLKGSPMLFYGSGTPDIVHADSSKIETSGSYIATGQDTCWITVTLMDRFNNPVSGKYVRLKVTGGINYYSAKIGPTNNLGKTVGHLISPNSGEKLIEATVDVDNIALTGSVAINFDPSNAAKIQPIFGSGQVGNVGTICRDSLAVRISDELNNPVADKRVFFQVTSEKGGAVTQGEVISDNQGIAATYLIFGEETGVYNVQAIANDKTGAPLNGSPALFSLSAKQGTAVSMFMVSGDNQEGPAGKILPDPLVVGVRDFDGQAVANVEITYTVIEGDGQVATETPVKTDMYGRAKAHLRADTHMGAVTKVQAKAAVGVLSGSPVTFTASSTQGEASKLIKMTGDGQTGDVGQTLSNPLVVKVTDIYENPVSGKTVTFTVVSGNASFNGQNLISTISNASGLASAVLSLGTLTGPVQVKVKSSGLDGSPLYFNASVNTSKATQLIAVSNLNIVASTNSFLPGSIRVQVQDDFGNGVPNISVYFSKTAGEGQIVDAVTRTQTGDQFAVSNVNGIAEIQYSTGAVAGTGRIRAEAGQHVLQFVIDVQLNASIPVLNKSILKDTYSVRENDQLNPLQIFLSAVDADGNPLSFTLTRVGAVSLPQNMTIAQQTATTGIIRWVPGIEDAGTYPFIVRVIDSHGGFDEHPFTVAVINSPQPPEITDHIPAAADTFLFAGQEHRFWVGANDPDGDALTYNWYLGGQPFGQNASLLIWHVTSNLSGNYIVTATVSDGLLSDSYSWNVQIIVTAVELAEFYAAFDLKTGFGEVIWSSTQENWNDGYEIYRSTREDGDYVKVSESTIMPNEEQSYRFVDKQVKAGVRYYYKLVDIDQNGLENEHGPVLLEVPKPEEFALSQNYPNPFNPVTTIRYEIPARDQVRILIYNLRGQEVVTLVDQEMDPGYYQVEWNGCDAAGRDLSTGLYIYRLQTPNKVITRRMIKMK